MSLSILHSVARRGAKRMHCFVPIDLISILSNLESLNLLSKDSLPEFEKAILRHVDSFTVQDISQTATVMQRTKWQNKALLDRLAQRMLELMPELASPESNIHPRTIIRIFVQTGLIWYKHQTMHDAVLQYLRERVDALNQDEREWIVSVAMLRLDYPAEDLKDFDVTTFEVVHLDKTQTDKYSKRMTAASASSSSFASASVSSSHADGEFAGDEGSYGSQASSSTGRDGGGRDGGKRRGGGGGGDDKEELDDDKEGALSVECREALHRLYRSCSVGQPHVSDEKFVAMWELGGESMHPNALARFLLCCHRGRQTRSPVFMKAAQAMATNGRVKRISASNFAIVLQAFATAGFTPSTHPEMWEDAMQSLQFHKDRLNQHTLITVLIAANQLGLSDKRFTTTMKEIICDETRHIATMFYDWAFLASMVSHLKASIGMNRTMLLSIAKRMRALDKYDDAKIKDVSHYLQALGSASVRDQRFCELITPTLEAHWEEIMPLQVEIILKYLNLVRIVHRPMNDVLVRAALKTFPETKLLSRLAIATQLTRLGCGEAYCQLMDDDWPVLLGEQNSMAVTNQILFLMSVAPCPLPPTVNGKPVKELLMDFLRAKRATAFVNQLALTFKMFTKVGMMEAEQIEWLRECITSTAEQIKEGKTVTKHAAYKKRPFNNIRPMDIKCLLYAAGGTQLIRSSQVQDAFAVLIDTIYAEAVKSEVIAQLESLKSQVGK